MEKNIFSLMMNNWYGCGNMLLMNIFSQW